MFSFGIHRNVNVWLKSKSIEKRKLIARTNELIKLILCSYAQLCYLHQIKDAVETCTRPWSKRGLRVWDAWSFMMQLFNENSEIHSFWRIFLFCTTMQYTQLYLSVNLLLSANPIEFVIRIYWLYFVLNSNCKIRLVLRDYMNSQWTQHSK